MISQQPQQCEQKGASTHLAEEEIEAQRETRPPAREGLMGCRSAVRIQANPVWRVGKKDPGWKVQEKRVKWELLTSPPPSHLPCVWVITEDSYSASETSSLDPVLA